ncbi:hypothetical protein JCM11641_005349, partial [Rhodosporidiobolus odoratus]
VNPSLPPSTPTPTSTPEDQVLVAALKTGNPGVPPSQSPGDTVTAEGSFPSRPGDSVDGKRSCSYAHGPGDTVDRGAGDLTGQGDTFDPAVQSAALILDDTIELGAGPEKDDMKVAEGGGNGSKPCNEASVPL